MKIGLGTVQFGLDYGISNRDGKTEQDEVGRILAVAAANGIKVIDTAASYGESESALGGACVSSGGFSIITKTPGFASASITTADADALERDFHRSLSRLCASSVYGLLIHSTDDLLKDGGELLMARMKNLQARGYVRKIGVSVYTADQIDRLLADFDVDLVQLPVSLLDQRLIGSGHLVKLKKKNIEIHARSVFLQGLALMQPESLHTFFQPIRAHLEKCRHLLDAMGFSPLVAAIAFVENIDEIDAIICGVNNHRQLEDICAAARSNALLADPGRFALNDAFFLNPANWKLQ